MARLLSLLAILFLATLLPAACGGDGDGGSSGPALTGAWQWEGTQRSGGTEVAPDDPSRYTLDLAADGTASVVADCNRSVGTWESDAGEAATSGPLTIALGPTTLVACEPGSLSDAYLAELQGSTAFELGDGKLRIDIASDGGTMTFAPAS